MSIPGELAVNMEAEGGPSGGLLKFLTGRFLDSGDADDGALDCLWDMTDVESENSSVQAAGEKGGLGVLALTGHLLLLYSCCQETSPWGISGLTHPRAWKVSPSPPSCSPSSTAACC